MKFRYIGEEPSEFFGFKWFPGVEHDVTDEHAIKKLANSVLFENAGTPVTAPDAKPQGKKKSQPVSDNGNDPNGA